MKFLVVYDTWFGDPRDVTQAISSPIREMGVEMQCNHIRETRAQRAREVLSYDLVLFSSSTYMGNTTSRMKIFFKKLSVIGMKGKAFAAFDGDMSGGKKCAVVKIEDTAQN